MYFQKSKSMKRILVAVLCLTLVTGQFVASPITVRAAISSEIELEDDSLLKYLLAKMGVFLNNNLFSGFKTSLVNVLYDSLRERDEVFKNLTDTWVTDNPNGVDMVKSIGTLLSYIAKNNALTTPIKTVEDMIRLKKVASDEEITVPDWTIDTIQSSVKNYLNDNTGYYLICTLTPVNMSTEWFKDKVDYDTFIANLKSALAINDFIYVDMHSYTTAWTPQPTFIGYMFARPNYLVEFGNSNGCTMYNSSWERESEFYVTDDTYIWPGNNSIIDTPEKIPISNAYDFKTMDTALYTNRTFNSCQSDPSGIYYYRYFYTLDGHPLKVFKNLTEMKNYTVGYQSYYVTNNYANYDNSVDNSQTFTGNSYHSSVSTNYYQDIQNQVSNAYNTDNSITEGDVINIVNNYYQTTIIQGGGSGGDTDGGDSGGSGGDSGGGGIGAIIEGIGKLLNAIATIIGKVVGLISDFLVTVLNILGSFTGVTDGFATILKSIFSFMPPEFIDTMVLGLTISILLCIIKFLKG